MRQWIIIIHPPPWKAWLVSPSVHCSSRKYKWLILCAKKCNSVCNFVCPLEHCAHLTLYNFFYVCMCVWIQLWHMIMSMKKSKLKQTSQTKWIVYKWSSKSYKPVCFRWESFCKFVLFFSPAPCIYFLLFLTAGGFCLRQSWEAGQCLLRMCIIGPNWLNPARRKCGNMNPPLPSCTAPRLKPIQLCKSSHWNNW